MIIARICLPGGKRIFHGSVEILGSPSGDDYRQGGWFPVDSFNFGFNEALKPNANDKPGGSSPAGKSNAGRPGGNLTSGTNSSSGSGEKNDFTSMELSKEVDRATCHLMVLAMEERSHKQGVADRGGEKKLHADIHVLGSIVFEQSGERNVYPSLMIHLEGVRVKEWNINGSGDDRPKESVKLLYDRAAMYYVWTDGKEFLHFGPKGWDQSKNGPWEDSAPAFEKYKPQEGKLY